MSEINLEKVNKIYFIGIGGIGMSALARFFLDKGKKIFGSDSKKTELTATLEREGAHIFYNQAYENITADFDLVIYTLAIPENNPELISVNNLGIPKLYYAEVLGLISKDFYTIAISGTHGKTTTTAMFAKVFEDCEQNPNVIVGSILSDKGSNYVKGEGNYFIVEACEYKRSFLNLNPKILIITNLEEDHLDYFRDLQDIQTAFHDLAIKIPADGYLICDIDDENLKPVIVDLKCNIIDYKKYLNQVPTLEVPGEHNIKNASSVIAVSEILNLDIECAKRALSNFRGTWRRSEFIRETQNKNLIYDDYAHHPSEIETTIKGFKKKFPDRKMCLIFEPHLYSRTKEHFDDFVRVLKLADNLILAPIFAAREIPDETINSKMLSGQISESKYFENYNEIKKEISEIDTTQKNILFLTMGAGSIYTIWN